MRRAKIPVLPGQELLLTHEAFEGPKGMVVLDKLRGACQKCTKCELHKERTQVVFGEGAWDSPPIAFVGEGPGYHEDAEGQPFVGKSGELLDAVLGKMGLARASVYITNTVKCRPPGNRAPTFYEAEGCSTDFLYPQLQAVKPKVIVALGKTAASMLIEAQESMRHLRGRWHVWKGFKVRVTWHPAYVLRKDREDGGASRWEMWSDMSAVLEELGLPVPEIQRRYENPARALGGHHQDD